MNKQILRLSLIFCLSFTATLLLGFNNTINSENGPEPASNDCPPGSVAFYSQADIDQFLIDYPNCTEISGQVYIGGTMTNLNGLANIQSITGTFTIATTSALTSLEGLNALTSIGNNFAIQNNAALSSISALSNLSSIGWGLQISNNASLTSLVGLESITTLPFGLGILYNPITSLNGLNGLTSTKTFEVSHSPELTSLYGLEALNYVEQDIRISNNPKLASISGLSGLTTIDRGLYISNLPLLTSLNGLENLTTLLDRIVILDNPSLQNLDGLTGLTSVGLLIYIGRNDALTELPNFNANLNVPTLYALENASLATCNSDWVCNAIINASTNFIISDNASGCQNLNAVSSSCGLITLEAKCKDISVAIQQGGQVSITAADVDDGSVNAATSTVSPSTFTCSNLGANTVTLTISDGNGNNDQCTATVTVQDGVGLAGGWSGSTIGTSALGDDFNFEVCNNPSANGQFVISSSGNNTSSASTDNIAFAYQTLCGTDATITAKIESVSANGYGGLMIRESTDENSKQVAIFSNLGNSLRHEVRYMTGANKVVQNFIKPSPYWLRLQRQGNWVFAYYSATGVAFQYVHAVYIPMDMCVEVGMASFTYLPNTQADATFSNVEVLGGNGASIEAPDIATTTDYHVVNLYPNPASSSINLIFEAGRDEAITAILRNQMGQIIEQRRLYSTDIRTEWDVSTLLTGIYFIEIRKEGQLSEILRFVKTL